MKSKSFDSLLRAKKALKLAAKGDIRIASKSSYTPDEMTGEDPQNNSKKD